MKTNSISAGLAVHARTITTARHLIIRRAWLWTGFLAFAMIAFAARVAQAAVIEAWVQRYGSEAGSEDYAYKVVTDAAGNVIVAGTSTHNQTGSGSDMLVIKYSGAGVPLWTRRYNGPGNGSDEANAVAVDGSGNVFVTGISTGSGGDSDYATIAYSGAGVALWTNRYNGPENLSDQANAVAVDGSGNVFVTGGSGYYCSFGCGGGDYATIAYSGAGVPLWTNRYDGPDNGDDVASAVAVDGSGNVFVTGSSGGDYGTIAYSGGGVPLWTNRYNGPENSYDRATAVAVDGSGNVIVTGSSDSDYVTIAYSGAGVPLWTNRYNGTGTGDDQPQPKPSLAIGSDDAVYVATSAGLFLPDFVTVKYVWQTEIAIQLLSTISSKVNLRLSGAPNSSWAIERALELTGPWTNLSALLIARMVPHSFKIPIRPIPLDSTVLGSRSGQASKFHLAGQPI